MSIQNIVCAVVEDPDDAFVHATVHAMGSAVRRGERSWEDVAAKLTAAIPSINFDRHLADGCDPFATALLAYADASCAVMLSFHDEAFKEFIAAQESGDAGRIKAANDGCVHGADAKHRAEQAKWAKALRELGEHPAE